MVCLAHVYASVLQLYKNFSVSVLQSYKNFRCFSASVVQKFSVFQCFSASIAHPNFRCLLHNNDIILQEIIGHTQALPLYNISVIHNIKNCTDISYTTILFSIVK